MKPTILFLFIIFSLISCKKDLTNKHEVQSESIKNDDSIAEKGKVNDSLQFIPIQIPDRQITPLEVKNYVNMLEGYRFVMGKNIDVSDLAEKLSEKMVTSINKNKNYNLDTLFTKSAEAKKFNMKCFTFGFDCGGTQGFINYPIITWINENSQLRAFNLSKYRTCEFTEIYKLDNDLFLLIGNASGSGACHQYVAYVVQIKNDKLNAEYKAFVNRPYLNFCNTEFKYDIKRKTLCTIPFEAKENIANNFKDQFMYRQFSKDTLANQKLYDMISDEYYSKGSIHLKFKNGKFQ